MEAPSTLWPLPRSAPPSIPERARLLLERWRRQLRLSPRETSLLGGELASLDRQLERLRQRRPRLAVFGRVGVGKSSLLNALLEQERFATDLAHGCTRRQASCPWPQPFKALAGVDLVDTPGIDEIGAAARARLAGRVALAADLVLLVIDGDLAQPELDALEALLASGKPLLLVLNRCDVWPEAELPALLASIAARLPAAARPLRPIAVAAAPRRPQRLADGRVRSQPQPPRIEPLRQLLIERLELQGELMLALNALRAADRFGASLHATRLRLARRQAQGLIGRYAAAKATGVALNPLPLLDLVGGMAADTAMVVQLSQLYGLSLDRSGARALLGRVGSQNALLGATALALQALLAGLRQALLLAAPLSGGLSLAPAAPVAMAQAALAVQASRRTGRLVAKELLRTAAAPGQPGALLRRLARQDPEAQRWLGDWREAAPWPADAGPGLLP
jgi:GTP-binding protein Era